MHEIQTLGKLQKCNSPNLPKLMEFALIGIQDYEHQGLSETWGYYITPFLENTKQPLSISGILKVCIQILDALEAVHSTGRTYNDLKMDNIIINRRGKATLIDFGLCKKFTDKIGAHIQEGSQTDSFKGNIMFSSPNVLNFGVPSRRDDLYQFAYMLLFQLNGNKFPGQLEQELEQAGGCMESRLRVSLKFKSSHGLTRLSS